MLVILFILLKKKIGLSVAIIFAFSLIVYDYFFVSYSLQGAPLFITMMISSIILLLKYNKIKNIQLYFFIIGCITNFVDFLTIPLITYAMPMFIYLLLQQKNNNTNLKSEIKTTLFTLFTWGIGYVLTWICKWGIYDLIYNKGLFESAFYQVFYRTTSNNFTTFGKIGISGKIKFITLENASISIYKELFNDIIIFLSKCFIYILLYLFIFGFTILIKCKKYKYKFNFININTIKKILPFLLVMLITLIWYIVLANHTILHTYFVYRNMIIILTGFLICFTKCINLIPKDTNNNNNKSVE